MAKTKKKKTDQNEYQKRLFTVQGWIIQGIPSSLIIKKVVQNQWCNERNAKHLLKKARAAWAKMPQSDLNEKRMIKIVQLEHMKLDLKQEYKGTPAGLQTLMIIEKELIKLEGLNAVPPVSINNNILNEQNYKVTVEVVRTGHPIARSEDDVIL